MLVSVLNKAQEAPLKVLDDKSAVNKDPLLQAIACKMEAVSRPVIGKPEATLQVVEAQPSQTNFTITFSYNQQLHRTKVLKVGSGYRKPEYVYKVALNSRLNKNTAICWLQQAPKGWALLLGSDIDPALVSVITAAIESAE